MLSVRAQKEASDSANIRFQFDNSVEQYEYEEERRLEKRRKDDQLNERLQIRREKQKLEYKLKQEQLKQDRLHQLGGADFERSKLQDLDFSKQSYRDEMHPDSAFFADADAKQGLAKKGLFDQQQEDEAASEKTANSDSAKKDDRKQEAVDRRRGPWRAGSITGTLGERPDPVHEIAGDWVPDKLDPTSNGGFTTARDNGSPVPYNLNGHVDIERGRP